jgi:hypothetical protein
MARITVTELDNYLNIYEDKFGEKVFLEHLEQFAENNDISACSIANKQSELTGEYRLKTYTIGQITISGANNNNPDYLNGSCPYAYSFTPEEVLKHLKHPCDTGIVNNNGTINIETLREFILENFEYDDEIKTYIIKKPIMDDNLEKYKERDQHLNLKPIWYLPSFETIAQGEWHAFFNLYCDRKVNGFMSVTLETFLQFYFNQKVLNKKLLAKNMHNNI